MKKIDKTEYSCTMNQSRWDYDFSEPFCFNLKVEKEWFIFQNIIHNED